MPINTATQTSSGGIQSELARAERFEESEIDPVVEAGPFSQIFAPVFDLISPTDPSGRDNLTLGLNLSTGYDTNVFYSSIDPIQSLTYSGTVSAALVVGTPRFQLDSAISASTLYYENRPGESDDNSFSYGLGANYQYRPRLGFEFDSLVQYLNQPSPQLAGGIFVFSGSYLVSNLDFAVIYEVRPRFSMVANYNFNAIRYEETLINEQSGYVSQTFALSGNYLLNPKTTLSLTYRFNPVDYYASGQGSDGNILLFGVTQNLSPRFDFTLSAGAERRSIREVDEGAGASEYTGPFVEGETSYALGEKSKIEGTLRYGTEPGGVSGVTIRQTFRAVLSIEQEFGYKFSGTALISYQNDAFDLPGDTFDYSQTLYSTSLSLRYRYNSSVSFAISYGFLSLESELPNSAYERTTVGAGIDFSF